MTITRLRRLCLDWDKVVRWSFFFRSLANWYFFCKLDYRLGTSPSGDLLFNEHSLWPLLVPSFCFWRNSALGDEQLFMLIFFFVLGLGYDGYRKITIIRVFVFFWDFCPVRLTATLNNSKFTLTFSILFCLATISWVISFFFCVPLFSVLKVFFIAFFTQLNLFHV